LDSILYFAKGNVAKAVQTLQLVSLLPQGSEITEEMIYETIMQFVDKTVDELLHSALAGNFTRGCQLIDEMIVEKGFLGVEILEGLAEALVYSGENDENIARFIVKISETDVLLKDAANERIHLKKLISNFS